MASRDEWVATRRRLLAGFGRSAGVAVLAATGVLPRLALADEPGPPPDPDSAPPPPTDTPPPPRKGPATPTPVAPPKARIFHCPIDGAETTAKGADGRDTTRRYSDLEMPTRAYTNLVVVCPTCGYANWAEDFERRPDPAVVDYAQRVLRRSAQSAAKDPIAAYQHLMNVLHVRRADLAEQIGASLYYTYVLKRQRPYGGLDPALERKILAARKRSMGLLARALKTDPPRQAHARLEWMYLLGELERLTGDTKAAAQSLRVVCDAQREAGYTIGRLSCEMVDRAAKNESWEDYRDGVFDARGIEAAEKDAERRRAEADRARAEAERAKVEEERAKAEAAKRNAPTPPPVRPHVPLPSQPSQADDPYAPDLPPIAR